jgi:hypothetical protein
MRQLFVFWDKHIANIDDILSISSQSYQRIIQVKGFSLSDYKPNSSNKSYSDKITTLNKERLMKTKFFDSNLEIFYKFKEFEADALKVIHRFLGMVGEPISLLSIEELLRITISNSYGLITQYTECDIVFFETPHYPFDYIFWKVASIMGSTVYVIKHLPLPHGIYEKKVYYVTNDFPSISDNHEYSFDDRISRKELDEVIEQYLFDYDDNNSTLIDYNPLHLGTRKKIDITYISNLLTSISGFFRSQKGIKFLINRVINQLKFIFLFDLITNSKLRKINKLSKKNINLNLEYIYYPLHFQPEASTIPLGGIFSNQRILIEHFVDNLPDNVFLYVREHPAYWYRKNTFETINYSRNMSFYRYLANSKKVVFVSKNLNHLKLIRNSLAVLTVTGNVALESLGLGRPCFFFGDYIYSNLPNIILKPSGKDLISEINEANNRLKEFNNKDMIREFFYSIKKSLFIVDNNNFEPYILLNQVIKHFVKNKS